LKQFAKENRITDVLKMLKPYIEPDDVDDDVDDDNSPER